MSGPSVLPLVVAPPRAMEHSYVVLDVFSDRPLEGNQLAVFLDGRSLEEEVLQSVARELKLAETVFVLPPRADGDVRLRIFTPQQELPFAGHPVLGAAVAAAVALDRSRIRLETAQAPVTVNVERRHDRGGFARLVQDAPKPASYESPEELLGELGLEHSELPVEVYENGPRHVFVALDSPSAVAAVRPNFEALSRRDICANVFARDGGRWKTRMFAPSLGVPEDAATGSAAGPLALHLARHGLVGFGDDIEIHQGTELGRPSTLHARAEGAAERVTGISVAGSAVVVARGFLYLD